MISDGHKNGWPSEMALSRDVKNIVDQFEIGSGCRLAGLLRKARAVLCQGGMLPETIGHILL